MIDFDGRDCHPGTSSSMEAAPSCAINVQETRAAVIMSAKNSAEKRTVPWDPRSICNLILDEADRRQRPITNLVLQKLLYFAHGAFLMGTQEPLVSGYFEAWQYGPVHPAAYLAFKAAGAKNISFRATRRDLVARVDLPVEIPADGRTIDYVSRVVSGYGGLSARQLVDISHARHGPWWAVVDKARTGVAFGMRIPEDVILDRFQHHKVSLSAHSNSDNPREDRPFA
jgi:uncharacterized phage-associated protein